MKKLIIIACFLIITPELKGQINQPDNSQSPPMGWLAAGDDVNEARLKEMAGALLSSGMAKIGYQYLFIEDGWQGGRDKKNNIIADPVKFPSGMKVLSDYVHSKGLKLGIYSAASQLSCNGYAGSLNFEDQDAATFADWGIDYLRYSYCGKEVDSAKILAHYKDMAGAVAKTGSKIGFGYPQTWRGTNKSAVSGSGNVNNSATWKKLLNIYKTREAIPVDSAFAELVNINAGGYSVPGPILWNEPPMLAVGLKIKGDPDFTDTEYQSQMSLFSLKAYPLIFAADVRSMIPSTKRLLMNEELIAINQDLPFRETVLKIDQDDWNVYVKPLSNGDYAVAILNRSDKMRNYSLNWSGLGLTDQFVIRDVWQHQLIGKGRRWRGRVLGHETRVFRLKKV